MFLLFYLNELFSSYEINIVRSEDKKRKLRLFLNDFNEFKAEMDALVKYNQSGYEIMHKILNEQIETAKEKNNEISDFDYDLIKCNFSKEEAEFLLLMDVHYFIICCVAELKEYKEVMNLMVNMIRDLSEEEKDEIFENGNLEKFNKDNENFFNLTKLFDTMYKTITEILITKFHKLKKERESLGNIKPKISNYQLKSLRYNCVIDKQTYLTNIGILPSLEVFKRRLAGEKIDHKSIQSKQKDFLYMNLYYRFNNLFDENDELSELYSTSNKSESLDTSYPTLENNKSLKKSSEDEISGLSTKELLTKDGETRTILRITSNEERQIKKNRKSSNDLDILNPSIENQKTKKKKQYNQNKKEKSWMSQTSMLRKSGQI